MGEADDTAERPAEQAQSQGKLDRDTIRELQSQGRLDRDTIRELQRQGRLDRDTIDELQRQGRLDRDTIQELQSQGDLDRALIAHLVAEGELDREKIVNLEAALETARRIGAAMGVLMAREKVTDAQAFDLLRTASQTTHRKLRDVAEDVALTGTLPSLPPGGHRPAVR